MKEIPEPHLQGTLYLVVDEVNDALDDGLEHRQTVTRPASPPPRPCIGGPGI
jgi:hypothetical protein